MIDDRTLNSWFCDEVLPLEGPLLAFIRRHTRGAGDIADMRQEIYERVLIGAREALPHNTRAYLFTTARNHLINTARRARIISFELVAGMEDVPGEADVLGPERRLSARDELRRALDALNRLPPRCREVVRLRKVEGVSIREAADRLGVSVHTIEKQTTNGIRAIADFLLGDGDNPKDRAAERSLLRKRKS